MRNLSIYFCVAVSMASGVSQTLAQDAPAKQASSETTHKHKSSAKKKTTVHEEDKVPDISAALPTEYDCEFGRKLVIYREADDDQHIALRWQKQILRLSRVQTTTGANRFENRKKGWVWIDIPTKGMLLDSKKGRQLANECRNPEQQQMAPGQETPAT